MTERHDQVFQSYFTVGLALHLEPLPSLIYDIVSENEEQRPEDERNVGPGKRLEPRLETFRSQSFETLRNIASDTKILESVEAWKKLFILLDAVDTDPHFGGLRQFFDARWSIQEQLEYLEAEEEDMEVLPRSFEHRLSFRSHRPPARVQWTRRPTVSGGEASGAPSRSLLGSIRRSHPRVTQDRQQRRLDMFELWKGPDDKKQCVRFNVRLDLQNVHLARPREMPQIGSISPSKISICTHNLGMTSYEQEPESAEAQDDVSAVGSQVSKRSFMHRFFDRGFRRTSFSNGVQQDDPDHPGHGMESDEEQLDSPTSPPVQRSRRVSTASSAARSYGANGPKGTDLSRVVEDSPFEPSEHVSTANRGTDLRDEEVYPSHIPFVSEGEGFLQLLRRATSFADGYAWPKGEQDPLPLIITLAMAEAFGWEGMMHLCYGKDSLCEKEQVFVPLGQAAYLESNRKQKYNAVLSWRNNIVNEDGSVPKPDEDQEYQEPLPPATGGELDSLPSRSSLGSHHDDMGEEKSDLNARARFVFNRTWNDWMLLFSSISSWISEYETTRVRAVLAHEFGEEPIFQTPLASHAGKVPQNMPPVCVERDAFDSAHGFWRLPGIPHALRSESHQEHMDYRWARTRLHSSQVGTPAVMSLASVQFYFMQLSSKSWVHRGSWELAYLNNCIFHSMIAEQRFPPPCDAVALPMPSTEACQTHTIQCPYPTPDGVCHAMEWKQWLHSLQDGQVIQPAVSWQGWWVLISMLNGGDRSGRTYDLQLRAPGDVTEKLDPMTVYL